MSSSAFARFWQTDLTREALFDCVSTDDLCSIRLVSRDIADDVAVRLFRTVKVNFNIGTFSRRARLLALERIGHHIKHFQFNFPHCDDTFLPPLIDPVTLDEVSFRYEPQNAALSRPSSSASAESESTSCKYGSWQMNDLLVRQYPPLFHAATDITSFTRAFSAMPCLRHLTISCPDQPAGQRYRRSVVDYAMISLRLAVEAAHPPFLDALSLDPMYPSAIFYLRPQQGICTSPASTRVWYRIRHVDIKMQNFEDADHDATDHLKVLHTYLQTLRSVECLTFEWLNEPGPCPLSLCITPRTSHSDAFDGSSASPRTTTLQSFRPMKLRKLRSLTLRNAVLDARQVSNLIARHHKRVYDKLELDFTSCHLRSGTWEDALAPLEKIAVNEDWRSETSSVPSSHVSEVMEVPIMYSPVEEVGNPMECVKELLWDQADRDVMRVVNKVASGVFRQVASGRREMLNRAVKTLFRSMSAKFHRMPCGGC